jgi:S-adenosylmethionine:tRNA ribosyltransferase-isomerase
MNNKKGVFYVEQWQPYQQECTITKKESFNAILDYLKNNDQNVIECKTSIIIVPGYRFRIINQLITNFHQPHSTLILLVAAFVGDQWRKIYNHALENKYRFLSYGDSSLLFGQ